MKQDKSKLDALRGKINKSDEALLRVLAHRFALTRKVGALKARLGIPSQDRRREKQVISRNRSLGKKLSLKPELIEHLFEIIFTTVRREHSAFRRTKHKQNPLT